MAQHTLKHMSSRMQFYLRVRIVGCGLLVPVFQERGTGVFQVVGTGPGQACDT